MTTKLAKIVLSVVAGMLGLVLVMAVLAGAGPAVAMEDGGQDGGGALLAGTPNAVLVDAFPSEIRADGFSHSAITGTVMDSDCMPVPGAFMVFTTTRGTIDQYCYVEAENASVTKSTGWQTSTYPSASGGQVVEVCGTMHPNATLSWTFGASAISMLYVKDTLGGIAEVRVDGGTPITVDMCASSETAERVMAANLGSGSHIIAVKWLTQSCGCHLRIDAFRCGTTTDENGRATATLTSTLLSCGSETATVTALSGDPSITRMITGTESVKMTASVPDTVTVTVNPNQITADRTSTSTLEATVRDQFGEYVPNCTMVGFVATDEASAVLAGEAWVTLPYKLVEGEDPTKVITNGWSISSNVGYHDGEAIYTNTAGATARWNFTGTAVSLMYPKLSDAGVASVTVDSGLPITIDMYSSSPQYQVEHVITHALKSGPHVITVTVAGYTVTGGTKRVYVDALRSGVSTSGGKATAVLTSGTKAGVVTVEATAVGRQSCEMDSVVTDTVPITLRAGNPYTLTITPTDITTTCCNVSTLQFTVTDRYSNVVGAVVPATVTVNFTSTPYGVFTPTSAVVTNGVGSVIFHGWVSGTGTITGTVQGYGVTDTSKLTVTAASCYTLTTNANPTRIYITDTNTYLLTNFRYTSTITAEVKDACGNAVRNGTVVTFTTSLGSLSPFTRTTISGVATTTLTSKQWWSGEPTQATPPTQTAYITVTGTSCPVSGTTSVIFGRHVYTLTVTANPDKIKVGGYTSTLTADVKDGFGDPTPDGVTVTFSITPTLATVSPGSVKTAGGKATVTATSKITPGVATIEAAAIGSTVTNTGLITITAGDPYTLTMTPTDISITCCVTSTLQFTVTDRYSNVVGAVVPQPTTVCLYCNPSGLVDSWSPGSCVAITTGVGSVGFHGRTAGTGKIEGYCADFSEQAKDTSNITVSASTPVTLTVTRAPTTILADGLATAIITATVKDACENPVCNRIVTFTTDLGSFVPPPTTTLSITKTTGCGVTSKGVATATLRSGCLSGRAYITVTADSLTGTTYVDMVGVPWDVQLTAYPTSIPVGGSTSNLTATVNDQFGHTVIDGTAVTFTTNLGSVGSTTIVKTTTGGIAKAVLTSSNTPGTATITATAGSGTDVATDTVTVTFTVGPPHTVTLVAYPMTLTVGSSSSLTATVRDLGGNNVTDGTVVTFTTNLGSVGSTWIIKTTTTGVATATLTSQVVGTALVTATADSKYGTTNVTFQPGLPYTLTLAAYPMTLAVGDSSSLTATVKDQYNNNVANGTVVTFETNLGSLGSVTITRGTTNGVATATLTSQIPGTATVKATADSISGTVNVIFKVGLPYTVTLTANPTSILVGGFTSTLTATVTDQLNNNVANGTVVTFTTSLGSLGGVTVTKPTVNGVATATLTSGNTAGAAVVTARSDSKVATTTVTFRPDVPYTITLVAYPITLTVGGTSSLTATVKDQYNNNVANGTVVTFETNLGSLGSVTITRGTANGVATATLTSQIPGTATVKATADSVSGTVNVIFKAGLPYTVTLTANPTSILVGGFTSTLTATVTDQLNNNVANGTVVTFTTSLGSLGGVTVTKTTVNGVATATLTSGNTAGAAVVTARSDSKVATTTVTFRPDVPYTVTLVAYPLTLTVGGTSSLTATVKDQYNNNVANGTVVTFETSLGSLGSVTITRGTANGVATATLTSQIPGTATVKATADSISGTVNVIFKAGLPYTVTLTANPTSILVGGFTSTLTVTATDQLNNNVTDGTVVTFATSLGSLGSVTVTKPTVNGVATATLTSGNIVGVAMVTATTGSKVVTTTVTFRPDVPYTVTLVAYPITLTVGGTSALTATVKDKYNNNVANGTVVTFETSLGSLGSITVTKPTTNGVAVATLTSQLPGIAMITATADSRVATTTVEFRHGSPYTVTLVAYPVSLTVGNSSSLTATVKDQYNNNVADGTIVTFTTNLGDVGSKLVTKVTTSGVATANLTSQVAGTALVSATAGSKSATANVTFNPGPSYTVTVMAYPTSIPIGGFTSTITATVKDQYANPVADGTAVTLATDLGSIGSSSVVKLTKNGIATATLTSGLIIGTANVSATSDSVVGQTQVIFTVGAPFTVTAESWPPTIEVGGNKATITATVTDMGGYAVANGTPVVFTTDFGSLGSSTVTRTTVSGVATATLTSPLTPGVAHITATAGSKSGTAIVKIAAGPPSSINVTANPTYIPIGGATSSITATVKDQYGNNVTNGTNVDFTTTLGTLSPSSNTTVGGMAGTTLTSGENIGTARVTAISGSASGWVDVVFTIGPPFYVDVVANPTSIGLNGQTSNIQAMVRDAGGNNVANGTKVIFITSLGALGSSTVTKTTTSGVAIAVLTSGTTAGTAVITATADSKYDVTEVVFNPDPPYTVTLTAEPWTIPADGISTSAVRATVTDRYGNLVANGTSCYFQTTLGTVWPSADTTHDGVAETTLTSSEDPGPATVTATCEGRQGTVYVIFYYPLKLYLPVIRKAY